MNQAQKYFLLLSYTLIHFSLSSCATTRMASQSDPYFSDKSYKKILIYFDIADLDLRKDAELTLQNRLSMYDINSVSSHQLFFIGRTYSDYETLDILESNKIDAVLVIAATNSGTSTTYVPPTTETKSSAWISGNYLSGSSTTRTYGGYNIHKPWASFSAQLVDVAAGVIVWVASAKSGGNAFANVKTLLRSMAYKTVEQLVDDEKVTSSGTHWDYDEYYDTPTKFHHDTRLPNFRAAIPDFNNLNDGEILAAYRKKFPSLRKKTDEQLIHLIELKYSKASK